MNKNINISLINNQIENIRIKNHKYNDNDDNPDNKTKIISYDFFSINNIKISEILAKIPSTIYITIFYFFSQVLLVTLLCFLKIKKLDH